MRKPTKKRNNRKRTVFTHHVYAEVFITTQQAIDKNTEKGRWVDLSLYENKESFISAMQKEVAMNTGVEDAHIAFARSNASFDTEDLILIDFIDAGVWDILAMSEHEVNLLKGWLSFYPMAEDGVQDTLFAASRYFEGRYEDILSYGVSRLQKLGIDEAVITALLEHSALGLESSLTEVAVQAGGCEEDLDILYDHVNFMALCETLKEGSFEHNKYYFEM